MLLNGPKILELMNTNDLIIESTITGYKFNRTIQVGQDAVDLRLCNYGYILSNEHEYINTLSTDSFDKYFIQKDLPKTGFLLEPNQILFINTLERVHIVSSNHYAIITGRSTFARMGISIHCTQNKVSSGFNSEIPLQITNNNPIPIIIYPFQLLVQISFYKLQGEAKKYDGPYTGGEGYILPQITNREKDKYKGFFSEVEWENIQKSRPRKVASTPEEYRKGFYRISSYLAVRNKASYIYTSVTLTAIIIPTLLSWNTIDNVIKLVFLFVISILSTVLIVIDALVTSVLLKKSSTSD